ncbi:single-strand DNA endonuclease ASTE1 [Clarias gariepinus]|uniref:protein asteroid homolog 1-like n=1 Tax=Clarias gariepinus TaxID=13013 RepID=UPI00234CCB3F|nr:protein asteroid homolog 1-like [Clarias gariepinus]
MGVKGLQTYIESNSDFLKTRLFKGSKLVIDGSSLYYCLYFRSPLDQAHGGDYDEFEKIVTLFFRNLRLCSIEPYVVLDGGDDASGRKFDTLKTRCQERIRRAKAVSRGGSGEILPILTKKVFKQILRKLAVPFIQCLAEADWEVAALANEWNCPVLSNDSDFYIFSLNNRFLPISHFQWRKVIQKSAAKKFILAKCFNYKCLCNAFNHMQPPLLPLFATILGNDYTKLDKSVFPNFSKFSTRPGGSAQIDGLLMWLSQYPSPKKAVEALLSPLGKSKKAKNLNTAINQGMKAYRLAHSSIAQFFITGEPKKTPLGPLKALPEWTLKPLAEGKLATTIIEVLTLRRVMLNIQVEDFSLNSSSEMSQLVRQVMYGVLLCTRWQKVSKVGTSSQEEQQYNVDEYDRQDMKLTCFTVPAVLPRCVVTHLHLDSLWEASQHLRLQVMLEALGVNPISDSLHVPEGLQLPVYVTCFWLKNAKPEPRTEMFWALLTGFVHGYLCRDEQTQKDVGPVISRFKKLKSRKGKKGVDLELARAYSQWLFCLRDSFILNQLLNYPVPEPELAWLYCGSLVHATALKLRKGIEPESFLAGAPVAIRLYRKLRAAVELELDDNLVARLRTLPREGRAPVDELSKELEHLMDKDEEDDEDEDEDEDQCTKDDKVLEEKCSVRTRHKTKRRSPKLRCKKHERVSWE